MGGKAKEELDIVISKKKKKGREAIRNIKSGGKREPNISVTKIIVNGYVVTKKKMFSKTM